MEHEERKAVSMLPRFFIGHTDREGVGESSERLFFSTHLNKGLVARLGGSVEMFEMVTSRQWNWSSQADLRKELTSR